MFNENLNKLMGIAEVSGLVSEDESGEASPDCGAVLLLNAGEAGMTGDELGIVVDKYSELTDEMIGELVVEDGEKARRVLQAHLDAQARREQALLCEDEYFDHDPRPSLYMGVDRDDTARVVELQLFIQEMQCIADDVQAKLDVFKTNPVKREVFMAWVERKKKALALKVKAIGQVQLVTRSRGEEYRKALWASYFQIDNLETWFSEYKDQNVLNTHMTSGEISAEFDNAILRSEMQDRGEELAMEHLAAMAAEDAIVNAPITKFEEPTVREYRGVLTRHAGKGGFVEKSNENTWFEDQAEIESQMAQIDQMIQFINVLG